MHHASSGTFANSYFRYLLQLVPLKYVRASRRLLLPSSERSGDSGVCDSGQNTAHLDLMDPISGDLIVSISNLHGLASHGHKCHAKENRAV